MSFSYIHTKTGRMPNLRKMVYFAYTSVCVNEYKIKILWNVLFVNLSKIFEIIEDYQTYHSYYIMQDAFRKLVIFKYFLLSP